MGGRLEGQITDLFPQLLGTGLALTCWPVTPSSGTPCTPPYPVKILSPSCDTASTPPACTQLSRGSVSSVSISAEAGRLFPENSLGNQVELGRAVRCQAGNGLTNGCWEVATCQRGLSCFVSSEHGRARSRTANSGSYTGLSTA